jgi:hypothetical protein
MIDKVQALRSLCPTAEWVLRGEQVEWMDTEQTQPTEAEIQAEITRLQAEYEANEYQRQRASAYPSIADQLDKIYHEGIDAWKAQIAAVKQEYPKP